MSLAPLSEDQYEILADAIIKLDPDFDYVKVDIGNLRVEYSREIKTYERIQHINGPEEMVRAYVVAWLGKVGAYPAEALELERKYSYGSGGKNAQLDIRISQADSTDAYALIELKQPEAWNAQIDAAIKNQLYAFAGTEPALEVLSFATVDFDSDGKPHVESITIDFRAYNYFESWVEADRPFRGDIPVGYSQPIVEPLRRGGPRDLATAINATVLNQRRRSLHSRLWGGSNDDNQIYGWLVRFFLAKIHDERTTNTGEEYNLQVRHKGPYKEPADVTAARVQEQAEAAHKRYIGEKSELPRMTGSFLSNGEIAWVVEAMQDISLTSAGQSTGDLLGSFFEGITREGFKQSKGLFFTHYNLAAFMVEALELRGMAEKYITDKSRRNEERLPVVMDPSCGSGTFLLAAMRAVSAHLSENREKLSINDDVDKELTRLVPITNRNQWASEYLLGIEKREDLAVSTKVNLVLHQDGATHIYCDDALAPLDQIADRHSEEKLRSSKRERSGYAKPVAESVDVIVTNPPFSITLDGETSATLDSEFELSRETNSENIFIERWYQLLKPGGRLAAVLPESTFSTAENARVRRFIFSHFKVKALVALPQHAFQPWTPTRTSILFAEKRSISEVGAWQDTFLAKRDEVATNIAQVKQSVRRLKSPRKKDDRSVLSEVRRTASHHLAALGVKTQFPDLDGDLDHILRLLKSVDADAMAFSETVARYASAEEYVATTVDEIGYRRTKRAENSRPNQLFTASLPDGSIIRNLNDNPAGWEMRFDQDDILSRFKEFGIWD